MACMSTFGERLKEARKDAKLSQGSLAKLVGLKQPTISELEADGKGSTYTAMLAKVLNVSAVWLADGKGSKKDNAAILDRREPVNDSEVSVTIPLLDILMNVEQGQNDALDSFKLTRHWVNKKLPQIKDISGLRFAHAEGQEMSGTFEDGDILLINTINKTPNSSGIYCIQSDSGVTFRRITKRLNGTFEISCDNPVLKATETLDDSVLPKIIGSVVWVWSGKGV